MTTVFRDFDAVLSVIWFASVRGNVGAAAGWQVASVKVLRRCDRYGGSSLLDYVDGHYVFATY